MTDFGYSAGLSPQQAVTASAALLDRALEHRVPIAANLHPLWIMANEGVLFEGLLDAAVAREIPILSAERWATQRWNRLHWVMTTDLTVEDGAWLFSLPEEVSRSVPQLLWSERGEDCLRTSAASAVGPVGCLSAWPPSP